MGHSLIQGISNRGGTRNLHRCGGICESALDGAEILQRLLIIAFQADSGESQRVISIDQVRVLRVEVAGHRVNLVRILRFQLRQVLLGGVEVLIGGMEEQDDIAGVIAAECFLLNLGRACRRRIGILPALLAHAVFELQAKADKQRKDGGDDDGGDEPAVRIGKTSPFFKHWGSLLAVIKQRSQGTEWLQPCTTLGQVIQVHAR